MALLLLLLVAMISDPSFVRKRILRPIFIGACKGLNEKDFLWYVSISLVCFFYLMGVSVMVQEFLFGIDVCHFFAEVKLFLILILFDIQNSLRSPIHAAIYGVCCLTALSQSNVVCLTVWSKSFIYLSTASSSGVFFPSRKIIISTEDPSRQQFLS